MKIWAKTDEFSEGKFLVTRRDGTTPDWPHFVIGARDPAAANALAAYAERAADLGLDPAFCESVLELASDFERYRETAGNGDPDAPPHRKDNTAAIRMMRHEYDVAEMAKVLLAAGHALRSYENGNAAPDLAKAIANEIFGMLA